MFCFLKFLQFSYRFLAAFGSEHARDALENTTSKSEERRSALKKDGPVAGLGPQRPRHFVATAYGVQ